jgi:hypothetical protein
MRRVHSNWFVGFRVHPPTKNTAAWKYKRVPAVVIDDGQFQITVERRGGYGLPLHSDIVCSRQSGASIRHLMTNPYGFRSEAPTSVPAAWPLLGLTRCTRLHAEQVTVS